MTATRDRDAFPSRVTATRDGNGHVRTYRRTDVHACSIGEINPLHAYLSPSVRNRVDNSTRCICNGRPVDTAKRRAYHPRMTPEPLDPTTPETPDDTPDEDAEDET